MSCNGVGWGERCGTVARGGSSGELFGSILRSTIWQAKEPCKG